MSVITRIAPSPTGFMHIGTARTALFNWLYAKHHGGKFYMRIEDTDRERSTPEATQAIIDGMRWLGLDWEGDVVYQYSRAARHADVAHEMIKHGKAFKCYTTQAELEEFRKHNPNKKFRSPWRDRPSSEAPNSAPYVVRLKAPSEGETVLNDLVQGTVTVKNAELDDLILLRSDGTPTYMLAVVVDDHDMGVTNIIRGDDHLTNTFKQMQIYDGMGWKAPKFAHIPLIHGADGAKLSKRHGALGVQEYEKMGYLPEAVCNYLLRLGWSHGDDEIIPREKAIQWFDLDAVGKSPSRFDFAKLENLNGLYIRESDDAKLTERTIALIGKTGGKPVSALGRERLSKGMNGLKQRAKTLVQLAEGASVYLKDTQEIISAAPQMLKDFFAAKPAGEQGFKKLVEAIKAISLWDKAALETLAKDTATASGVKLGDVAQPLRIAISASTVTPPIFEVMEILGRDESLTRLAAVHENKIIH